MEIAETGGKIDLRIIIVLIKIIQNYDDSPHYCKKTSHSSLSMNYILCKIN